MAIIIVSLVQGVNWMPRKITSKKWTKNKMKFFDLSRTFTLFSTQKWYRGNDIKALNFTSIYIGPIRIAVLHTD